MGDSAVLDDDDMAAEAQLDDDVRGETPESTDSTPEADATAEASQEPAQPQKRKGGRKPVCICGLRPLHYDLCTGLIKAVDLRDI